MNPMETMLGKKGDPLTCNQFVHWWAIGAKAGSLCLCGQKIKGKKRKAADK